MLKSEQACWYKRGFQQNSNLVIYHYIKQHTVWSCALHDSSTQQLCWLLLGSPNLVNRGYNIILFKEQLTRKGRGSHCQELFLTTFPLYTSRIQFDKLATYFQNSKRKNTTLKSLKAISGLFWKRKGWDFQRGNISTCHNINCNERCGKLWKLGVY